MVNPSAEQFHMLKQNLVYSGKEGIHTHPPFLSTTYSTCNQHVRLLDDIDNLSLLLECAACSKADLLNHPEIPKLTNLQTHQAPLNISRCLRLRQQGFHPYVNAIETHGTVAWGTNSSLFDSRQYCLYYYMATIPKYPPLPLQSLAYTRTVRNNTSVQRIFRTRTRLCSGRADPKASAHNLCTCNNSLIIK